mmetsp:Transcript_8958/g.11427  ORF Transcript_8958/g.11427 Transcript_8958/m.11427 type:complete len:101 (-) Transcript_8958:70-372(-)
MVFGFVWVPRQLGDWLARTLSLRSVIGGQSHDAKVVAQIRVRYFCCVTTKLLNMSRKLTYLAPMTSDDIGGSSERRAAYLLAIQSMGDRSGCLHCGYISL